MEKINGKIVKFKQWDCIAFKGVYRDERIAIRLIDAYDGEPVATSTVFLEHERPPLNHVHIKEWSENEGMTEALIKAGMVRYTGKKVEVNNHGDYANLCELLI